MLIRLKMKKHSILVSLVFVCFVVGNFNLQAQDEVLKELAEIAIIDQKIMVAMMSV